MEQIRDRLDQGQRFDGCDQVVADAAPRELAIEQNVVHVPDDKNLRASITDFRETIEACKQRRAVMAGLENDDIRGRLVLVELNRGSAAAFQDLNLSVLHSAVFRQLPQNVGNSCCFMESMDCDSWDGRNDPLFVGRLTHD